jgi:hypothetical protein
VEVFLDAIYATFVIFFLFLEFEVNTFDFCYNILILDVHFCYKNFDDFCIHLLL